MFRASLKPGGAVIVWLETSPRENLVASAVRCWGAAEGKAVHHNPLGTHGFSLNECRSTGRHARWGDLTTIQASNIFNPSCTPSALLLKIQKKDNSNLLYLLSYITRKGTEVFLELIDLIGYSETATTVVGQSSGAKK